MEDQFQEELTQHHIDYRYEVDQSVEYVSYVSLYQAILKNLVENAIHYRRSREPFILLKVKNTSSALTIQIVDNGIGIPDHLQSTVFNMYTKASDRTSGNGLGLFVVKKLVLALGGTIEVTSVAGKGSTFTITLPLTKALLPED